MMDPIVKELHELNRILKRIADELTKKNRDIVFLELDKKPEDYDDDYAWKTEEL